MFAKHNDKTTTFKYNSPNLTTTFAPQQGSRSLKVFNQMIHEGESDREEPFVIAWKCYNLKVVSWLFDKIKKNYIALDSLKDQYTYYFTNGGNFVRSHT